MKTGLKNEALSLSVQDIPRKGKRLWLELDEADLAEIIGRDSDVYHTTGQGLTAELQLTRQGDNVFVQGHIQAGMVSTCCRCLKLNPALVDVVIRWTFLPFREHRQDAQDDDDRELTADDLDVSFYDGETIEIGQILQEAVLLELDPYPCCPDGGCDRAGLKPSLPDSSARGLPADAPIDPRWLPLAALANRSRSRRPRRKS